MFLKFLRMEIFKLIQYTIWPENLTVIKFYNLSKLLREKKLAGFKFMKSKLRNLVSSLHNSKTGFILYFTALPAAAKC